MSLHSKGPGQYLFDKYLAGAGLCAILLVVSVGLPEFILVHNNAIRMAENHAVEIANGLSVCEITTYIQSSTPQGNLAIPADAIEDLDEELSEFLDPFSLIKIKIFDRNGKIVFSSDQSLIGKMDRENSRLNRALDGEVVSEMEIKDEVADLVGEIRRQVNVVETYLPLRNASGKILGVFELYTDVQKHLEDGRANAAKLVGGLAIAVMLVFGLLTVFVKRLTIHMDLVHTQDFENRRELVRSKNFLQSVIDALPEDFMVLNLDHDILLANRKVLAKIQEDPVACGMKCYQVSHHCDEPCNNDEEPCPLVMVMQRKEPVTCLHRHFGMDGKENYVEVTVSPVFDDEGSIIQYIENSRDITERIQAEQGLAAASLAKSHFLANMSHEIRTPLTAILGYADLIADEAPSPEKRNEYLSVIRRNGEHLLALINDILDLAKIEAGKLTIEMILSRPEQIMADVTNLMHFPATAKGLKITTKFLTPVPETIQTDPTRLKQALVNLLGNAVKFTDQGEIGLTVAFDNGDEMHPPSLVFQVTDSGIGMDEKTLGQLFKPFNQGDASINRRFGGTGLGLVITRRVAHLLGGEVAVASELGKGTTFTLTITTGDVTGVAMVQTMGEGIAAKRMTVGSQTCDLTGVKILYAEDGRDNQVLVGTILRKAGAEVDIAENGAIAVEKTGGKEYDLILMDQQMPEMDGLTATRLLRSRGYHGPIVALSANAMESDRELSLEAGCNEHLTKPINRKLLLATVAGFCCATVPGS